MRRLTVAGTFSTGRTEQEERVALPLALAATLVGTAEPRSEVDAGGLKLALAVAHPHGRVSASSSERWSAACRFIGVEAGASPSASFGNVRQAAPGG